VPVELGAPYDPDADRPAKRKRTPATPKRLPRTMPKTMKFEKRPKSPKWA
jgi:hypothetical protein